MFSWVIWFPAPGSIPADVIKTTEPWWVYESGRSNVSTAKAWESLLGRGSRTVTSIIVKSSVHSFISRWIRQRFGMRKGARNRDNAFALYAKWLSQPRKWNCSLRKGSHKCENEFAPCAKWLSQPRSWDCPLRKLSSQLPKWNCPSDNGASAIAIGLCTAAQAVHLNCVWIIVVIANACSLWGLKECSSVILPFAMDMLVFLMKNESAQQSIVITAQTI